MATLTQTLRILLVEDDPQDAYLLRRAVHSDANAEYEVRHVTTLGAAVEALRGDGADCVILDLSLPDAEGVGTVEHLAAQVPDVPIVVLTGRDDEALGYAAIKAGAQDYLVKGVHQDFVMHAVRYAIERHQLHATLRSLSLVDELTGLHNRRGFQALAEHNLKLARRMRRPVALFFMDLDRLKAINDVHGHAAGDQAIRRAAAILRSSFRETDVVARLGGDEFTALALNVTPETVPIVEERLAERTRAFAETDPLPFPVTMTAGVALHDAPGECSLQELLLKADQVLYRRKRAR